MLQTPRIALVHDWLTGMRGGEKVLEVFCQLFPEAPIYTLLHVPGSVAPTIERHRIVTSPLQKLPLAATKYRYYLPFFPRFAESLKIEPVDLVLSTSSCAAKGIVPPTGAVHASYILSPMRYLYDRYDDYFAPGRAGWLTRQAMRWQRPALQRWDFESTRRVDHLVGISTFICERIQRIYQRSSRLIFPPVDVERFAQRVSQPKDYYLIVSSLVPYKNVDIALEAFRQLPDRRLIVAGDGPMRDRLLAIKPNNVEMRAWVDNDELEELVANCRAFVFPNVEDFGIAPLEASAAGRPVIALGQGGARDTIRDLFLWQRDQLAGNHGPTGVYFDQPTPRSLAEAVRTFEAVEDQFHPHEIRAWARQFDRRRFEEQILDWLSDILDAPAQSAAA